MKALVFSAGGMFGAYQAGVWQELASWFKPDIVVGTSIGALNGWAIAGGCAPDELAARWSDLSSLCCWRLRRPWTPAGGLLDCGAFEEIVRDLYPRYRPVVPFGVVLTDVRRLEPRLFSDAIGWEHLAAACAVPVLFPQRRIGGRLYVDGGLLDSCPLWAAARLGAEKILAVQVLPCMPSRVVRLFVKGVRLAAKHQPRVDGAVTVMAIGPREPLGRAREMLNWDKNRTLRWMDEGRAEAREKKRVLIEMFGE